MHLEMSKKALSGEYIRYKWSFDFGDTMYYFESSVSAIKTKDGKIVGLVGVARNITEEKRIEDEKDYKDKFLSYIIQYSMSSIAIFDDKMNYIYVSQKFKEINSVTDEDILGKNHYELFPETPERLKKIHQNALNGEVFTQERDYIVRNDGRYEWMRWECRPWYKQDQSIGGIILYVDNLDEQIALEEEILTKSREIEATLESIGEAVISVDNQGNIMMLNRRAEELTGFHRDAVIGKMLFEVITVMDHQENVCDRHSLSNVFEKKIRTESKHHF
ncbi:MAG: PAS domain S-box protein, partial [Candidatus Moranbacteria bacterium]|nr:PAS domain S-box protein [Candidatus Moranbacteria bacterium]